MPEYVLAFVKIGCSFSVPFVVYKSSGGLTQFHEFHLATDQPRGARGNLKAKVVPVSRKPEN